MRHDNETLQFLCEERNRLYNEIMDTPIFVDAEDKITIHLYLCATIDTLLSSEKVNEK